jgi:HlyD family secretion protein
MSKSVFTRKRVGWSLTALIAAALLSVVVRSVAHGPQTTPGEKDRAKATKILPGVDEHADVPLGDYVAGNAIVEPSDRETKVAGEIGGRIRRLLVKEGDHVEAGQTIAELDDAVERAALAAAEGDVDAANADFVRTARGLRKEDVDAVIADTEGARARAQLSRDSLARTEKLAQGGASTPDELDRARRQADADQRALESSEARKRAALAGSRVEDITQTRARALASAARRDQARAQLERLAVHAPITGEILQVKYRAGEYYQPGGDPIAIMGDTSVLRARIDVDERSIARLSTGASAFVTAPAFPNRRFAGKVVEIGKRMGRKNVRTDDPVERIDTKILEVVVQLDDGAKPDLVPGLRVVGYIDARKER